ncbi:MAG: S1C family serine protease [Thermoleophilia bacterium]
MTRLRSRGVFFISGVAVTALALVALMALGVLPVRTVKTAVVTQQTAVGTTAASTAASGEALTPAQIYRQDSSGVVEVVSTLQTTTQGLFGPVSGQSQALGSGFVVSKQGYILTNAHVVSSNGKPASAVSVVFKGKGSQTTRVAATIVGVDETSDVAVLKVDPAKAPALNPLVLGDSSKAQVGEPVVAIGNPLGFDFSLTSGIVSATDRNLQSPNGSTISNGIQTDAAINEGNSGGPLIDSSGKVIGINEQIASQSGGNQGLGFAVPIDTAAAVMSQIERTGNVTYAWLGVSGQTVSPDVAKALGLGVSQGVLVAGVESGSPAAKAGIRGGQRQVALQNQVYVTGGDVITKIDGRTVSSNEQLSTIVLAHKPGDQVTVTVVRGSATTTLTVTLGTRPKVF